MMTFGINRANTMRQLAVVVGLLALQFLLRAHSITQQGAFVDEGYHTDRAVQVYKFAANPGEFANGKILVYYWLGLFQGARSTALFASRTAIALFSLVTGATIYLIGRQIVNHSVGVAALALYIVLPFAFFYDRLALADPFASAFACLVVWRSIAFGKHPKLRDSLWLGFLLAFATLAKLTLGLIPIVPIVASIIYFPDLSAGLFGRIVYWLKHYLPPLILSAVVLVILWSPILLPAYIARVNNHSYSLVSAVNIAQPDDGPATVLAYLQAVAIGAADFFGLGIWGLLTLMALCTALALRNKRSTKGSWLLLYWLAAALFSVIGLAAGADTRYLVPAVPPVVLLATVGIYAIWQQRRFQLLTRTVVVAGLVVWLFAFAGPFIAMAFDAPPALPLTGNNHDLFFSGGGNADARLMSVSSWVDTLDTNKTRVYSNWVVCYLMYFYTHHDVSCLEPIGVPDAIKDALVQVPSSVKDVYIVVAGYDTFNQDIPGMCVSHSVRYTRPETAPLDVWKLTRQPCGSP